MIKSGGLDVVLKGLEGRQHPPDFRIDPISVRDFTACSTANSAPATSRSRKSQLGSMADLRRRRRGGQVARPAVRPALRPRDQFIDTANDLRRSPSLLATYGVGVEAETKVLGEDQHCSRGGDCARRTRPRDSYILATKLFAPMSDTDKGLSRAQVFKQIDASLGRLKTDYVDLYQCHRYDVETPLEETMQALSEIVKAGKVRWIGFSEWSPEQIEAAIDMTGVEKFVSSQPQYSLLYRRPEKKVIPLCAPPTACRRSCGRPWPRAC